MGKKLGFFLPRTKCQHKIFDVMPVLGLGIAAVEVLSFEDEVSRSLALVGGLLCLVLSYASRRRP